MGVSLIQSGGGGGAQTKVINLAGIILESRNTAAPLTAPVMTFWIAYFVNACGCSLNVDAHSAHLPLITINLLGLLLNYWYRNVTSAKILSISRPLCPFGYICTTFFVI